MSGLDDDGDSQMQSSLASSTGDISSGNPLTPTAQQGGFAGISELSPPGSQSIARIAGPNANGKRPLSIVDSNGDAPPALRNTQQAVDPQQVKTHESSGYRWTKQDDEPGWSWKNKRAMDEANRAYDSLVMKDIRIGDRYGDPFAMADHELAIMRSQGQT